MFDQVSRTVGVLSNLAAFGLFATAILIGVGKSSSLGIGASRCNACELYPPHRSEQGPRAPPAAGALAALPPRAS